MTAEERTAPATRPGLVFAIVCTGVILATLDQFIVNIAFTAIGRSLQAGTSTLSWVLNGYSIVFAALLIPAGRLADRGGRKLGFLVGVAVFTLASVACAVAPSVGVLIGARLLQAVGAALLVPSSLGLLLAAFPAERRAGAVRAWTAVTGLSAALGPVLGGVLVTASWRWIFLVNVPIGVVALAAGSRLLPRIEPERGPIPDLLGAGLVAAGIGAVSLGLVEGQSWGWASGGVLGSFAAAVVLTAAFVERSRRHPSPVVELALLRVRRFSLATAAMTIYSTAFAAMLLSTVLWGQEAWGWSALRSGLCLAPGPLMVPLFSLLSGRLIGRVGPGAVAVVGCGTMALAALVMILRVGETPHYATGLLPGTILTGVAVGLALPTLMGVGSGALPASRFATGSGVLSMGRQLGFTLGVSVLIAVLGKPAPGHAQLAAFRHGWIAIAAISAGAAAIALLLARPARSRSTAESPVTQLAGATLE